MKRISSLVVAFLLIFTFVGCGKENTEPKEIMISVAASLEDPIREIISKYEAENENTKININLGSSGTLRKQIQDGSGVDLFLSASEAETDKLIESGELQKDNVRVFLSSRLVLLKSKNSKSDIKSIKDLDKLQGKIAIGAEGVPIGEYSRESLQNVGVWDKIQENIVFCKDAKSVLNYVKLGEVDYSIVYANEKNNLGEAEAVELIDASLHSPVTYTFALLNTKDDEVSKFKKYIDENIDIFEKYNFERK